jgi:hypothetical protein
MRRQSSHDRTAGGGRSVEARTSDSSCALEIRRSDLEAAPIRTIIDRLHRTGKLALQGDCTEDQFALFTENAGIDNAS